MENFSFKWFLSLVIAIIFQVYLLNIISIDGMKPDVVLIVLIFYCLNSGQIDGMVLAFFTGFLMDFLFVGVLGASSFSKVFSIFLCGYFYNVNRTDLILSNYNFIFIVFLISFVDGIIFSLITIKTDILSFSILLFKFGIFPAVYTAVISTLVYLKSPKKLFSYGK